MINVFYRMVQLQYVTLLLSIQCWVIVSGEEGDSCSLLAGGQGTCKNVHRCPYAISLLKKGIYPELCGFTGLESLVCCKEEIRQVAANRDRKPGELSKKKCKEYYPEAVFGVSVTGGEPSLAKEFPHMAAIGYGEEDNIQWLCGGSLISKNFILTAAHCLNNKSPNPARWVRLGELDFATDQDDALPQDYTIKRRIPHPEYRGLSRYHDIGLIELDREVTLSDYVGIACLDTVRQHEGTPMVATGWGNTEFSGKPSTALLKIELDVKSPAECQMFYGISARLPNGVIDDRQICAGGKVGKDTCQGDSGGPLQLRNYIAGHIVYVYDIIGVTSFGKACGITRTPGIYTRVYNYLSWIENMVWPSE